MSAQRLLGLTPPALSGLDARLPHGWRGCRPPFVPGTRLITPAPALMVDARPVALRLQYRLARTVLEGFAFGGAGMQLRAHPVAALQHPVPQLAALRLLLMQLPEHVVLSDRFQVPGAPTGRVADRARAGSSSPVPPTSVGSSEVVNPNCESLGDCKRTKPPFRPIVTTSAGEWKRVSFVTSVPPSTCGLPAVPNNPGDSPPSRGEACPENAARREA
eukprot:CAMPEP_0180328002 /NCGR_PEP_ID=MMETSP0988-20121125/39896_1 /TAXON_ID=697907 /ORGANISM="non described non described, Strain CCMP2293" /LENGTH=216 /DNA_ID=CAMNT_0022314811 /DNA_START=64 /DNA_END=713 /DNA_ORIENTATION=+